MTLTQLNYIIAVDKFRNFGQAAEACEVTQPTLSMQVQKLEEQFGVLLFDRSHQPIKVTPIGELIIAQARHVMREADRIDEIIKEQQGEISGEVRLGVIPTLAPYLLPLFLNKFLTENKKLKLIVQELQTHQILEMLEDGNLDIGILVTPIEGAKYKTYPLFFEPFLAYFSENHPLLKNKTVDEKDLSTGDLWLLSEGHCFREQSLLLCKNRKKNTTDERRLQFDSGSLETLKKIIDREVGFTLLPWLSTQDIREVKRLREFEQPIPTREVSLITGHYYRRETLIRQLSECIKNSLPKDLQKVKSETIQRIDLPIGILK